MPELSVHVSIERLQTQLNGPPRSKTVRGSTEAKASSSPHSALDGISGGVEGGAERGTETGEPTINRGERERHARKRGTQIITMSNLGSLVD